MDLQFFFEQWPDIKLKSQIGGGTGVFFAPRIVLHLFTC